MSRPNAWLRPAASTLLGALALAGCAEASRKYTLGDCQAALRALNTYPGNTSVPFMASATGHFDLAVSFQSQVISVLPAKVFGQFDVCQTPQLYSYGAVQTQFCTLGGDRAGICVPVQCTEEVLRSQVGNMEFTTFIAMLAVNATMAMPMPCAFDPMLTPFCASKIAARDYFENLYDNFMIFATTGISCGGGTTPADPSAKRMIAFTALLIIMVAVGSIWGCYRESAQNKHPPTKAAPTLSPRLPDVVAPAPPMPGMPPAVGVPPNAAQPGEQAIREVPVVLKAFDIRDNLSEMFALSSRPGEFSCFDGMRALSCGWVIIYHVILWQTRFIQNPDALLPPLGILAEWWSMPLFNFSGTLCVDTFLFISAFLGVFLLLKKLEKEKRPLKTWMPLLYLNRFVRITPAYMFALFLNWKLAPLVSDGPLAKTVWRNSNLNCPDQWWRHLLYINTVSPWDAVKRNPQCFGHTWYLADDMFYFYTIAPLVLLYRWNGNMGKALAVAAVGTLIFSCVTWNAVTAYQHQWSPNTWDGDAAARYNREAFEVPWSRAPSYFIGVLTAFLWYEKKRLYKDWRFPTWLVGAMVFVASFLMLGVMYGPATGSKGITACIVVNTRCGSDWDASIKVLLAAFARPAWAIGIALMCMLCFNNQAGFVNPFLSASIWAPMSFLSYTVYLVHYTILTYYMAGLTARIRWEFFDFVVLYLGLTAMSHGLALFVALLVEKPAMKLQKYYLEGGAAAMAAKAAKEREAALAAHKSVEMVGAGGGK